MSVFDKPEHHARIKALIEVLIAKDHPRMVYEGINLDNEKRQYWPGVKCPDSETIHRIAISWQKMDRTDVRLSQLIAEWLNTVDRKKAKA
jgi:hypothetical protein